MELAQPLPVSLHFVNPIAPVLWPALFWKVMRSNTGFSVFSLDSLHCTKSSRTCRKISGQLCKNMFPWQGVQHCTKPDNKCQNHFHAMGVSSSCFQVGCFLMLWTSMLNFMISLVQMLVWDMFGKANRTLWKMSWQKDPLNLFNLGLFAFQQIWVGLSPQCCHCVCVETVCFCCFFDSYGYFLCRCGSISMHKHAIVGWKSVCQLFLLPRVQRFDPQRNQTQWTACGRAFGFGGHLGGWNSWGVGKVRNWSYLHQLHQW